MVSAWVSYICFLLQWVPCRWLLYLHKKFPKKVAQGTQIGDRGVQRVSSKELERSQQVLSETVVIVQERIEKVRENGPWLWLEDFSVAGWTPTSFQKLWITNGKWWEIWKLFQSLRDFISSDSPMVKIDGGSRLQHLRLSEGWLWRWRNGDLTLNLSGIKYRKRWYGCGCLGFRLSIGAGILF